MGLSRLRLNKPVIAAVVGPRGRRRARARGSGATCAWSEESAVFGVFCRRWGVPLIDGGTVRLPRLIGMSHALDMILTGRAVGAPEALAMGLANRVVPDGTARASAEALAAEIARFPQACLRADRLSALEQAGLPVEEAMRNEFARGATIAAMPEMREGAARFAAGAGRHGT